MQDFIYYAPTKVAFGRDSLSHLGGMLQSQGCKKVLLHYGGTSAEKSGLLDKVRAILKEQNIAFVELGGVVPNPRISKVYEGIALAKKEGVDFLLAVGGGSVIDSTKAISYGLANSFDVWELYEGKRRAEGAMPIGVVLTLSAAGSEMSNSSVISDDEKGLKRGYGDNLCRPKFAIMNPEYTMSLPAYQTACGTVDIMMHTMERYFIQGETMELTDGLAESLIKTVMEAGRNLLKHPNDYDARANIMWASSLSHNGLTGCGGGNGDWATHRLEHELSAMFDVAHGAGLASLWGSWARYVLDGALGRFKKFAVNVMGVCPSCTKSGEQKSDRAIALEGIEKAEAFFKELGMPTKISDFGIELTEEQLRQLAKNCSITANDALGNVKVLKEADMYEIFKMAK